jgi:Lon protease-like protein
VGFAPWQLARAYDRDAFPGIVPVFALPGVTFFPHTLLPLHVFEERYREMVRETLGSERETGDTLGQSGLIAVAGTARSALTAMPAAGAPNGSATLARVAGVGQIIAYQPLEDGRSNIVLIGIGRVRLREWVDHGTLYPQARAELLHEPRVRPGADASAQRLKAALERAGRRTQELGRLPGFEQLDDEDLPLEVVVDHLASLHLIPAADRQEILECDDLPARARLVAEAIAPLAALRREPPG